MNSNSCRKFWGCHYNTIIWIRQSQRAKHIKRSKLYNKCYEILGVESSADQNTVRRAYIALVKKVHPDSGESDASARRFQEVDEAFKILQEKFAKNRRDIYDDEDEQVFDINHTAPQHRQYLNFDGVGIGNPFQREKQYQQVKALKAQDHVLKHRIEKSQASEGSLLKKNGVCKTHSIKTKYGIERVVEDLIQEAIAKGDFNNLTGTGKPLSAAQTQNPYLDFTTHKLNKILIDNGFTPEWITLQRDIRIAVKSLKQSIKEQRACFGEYPFDEQEAKEWQKIVAQFEDDVRNINKNIDKFNLIVPILNNQMFRLNLNSITEEIIKDPNMPKNYKRKKHTTTETEPSGSNNSSSSLLSFIGSFF